MCWTRLVVGIRAGRKWIYGHPAIGCLAALLHNYYSRSSMRYRKVRHRAPKWRVNRVNIDEEERRHITETEERVIEIVRVENEEYVKTWEG